MDPEATGAPYTQYYSTSTLKQPIYQVMGSGMSASTTNGLGGTDCGDKCCGWQRDLDGLRPGGKCSIWGDVNFGLLSFDWERREVTMHVLKGHGGGIATGAEGDALSLTVCIDTCQPV